MHLLKESTISIALPYSPSPRRTHLRKLKPDHSNLPEPRAPSNGMVLCIECVWAARFLWDLPYPMHLTYLIGTQALSTINIDTYSIYGCVCWSFRVICWNLRV